MMGNLIVSGDSDTFVIFFSRIYLFADGTRMNLYSSAGPSLASFLGTYLFGVSRDHIDDQACCRLHYFAQKSPRRISRAAGARNIAVKITLELLHYCLRQRRVHHYDKK